MTFDNTLNTFDESVAGANTRQGASSVFTSFDETGITFDSSSEKFDTGS